VEVMAFQNRGGFPFELYPYHTPTVAKRKESRYPAAYALPATDPTNLVLVD